MTSQAWLHSMKNGPLKRHWNWAWPDTNKREFNLELTDGVGKSFEMQRLLSCICKHWRSLGGTRGPCTPPPPVDRRVQKVRAWSRPILITCTTPTIQLHLMSKICHYFDTRIFKSLPSLHPSLFRFSFRASGWCLKKKKKSGYIFHLIS